MWKGYYYDYLASFLLQWGFLCLIVASSHSNEFCSCSKPCKPSKLLFHFLLMHSLNGALPPSPVLIQLPALCSFSTLIIPFQNRKADYRSEWYEFPCSRISQLIKSIIVFRNGIFILSSFAWDVSSNKGT